MAVLLRARSLNSLRCLTVDIAGRIYITDASDLRVRQVGPQAVMTFAPQAVGTTSNPQTIVLNNTGNATLDFTGGSPVFIGADSNDFRRGRILPIEHMQPYSSGAHGKLHPRSDVRSHGTRIKIGHSVVHHQRSATHATDQPPRNHFPSINDDGAANFSGKCY